MKVLDWIVAAVGIMSLMIIMIVELNLTFLRIGYFENADVYNKIITSILYSVTAACIFYFITTFVPSKRKEKQIRKIISNDLQSIVSDMKVIIAYYITKYNIETRGDDFLDIDKSTFNKNGDFTFSERTYPFSYKVKKSETVITYVDEDKEDDKSIFLFNEKMPEYLSLLPYLKMINYKVSKIKNNDNIIYEDTHLIETLESVIDNMLYKAINLIMKYGQRVTEVADQHPLMSFYEDYKKLCKFIKPRFIEVIRDTNSISKKTFTIVETNDDQYVFFYGSVK